jgi:hypothetical protein
MAFQQGRSERTAETYCFKYVAGWERCENDAGGLFQQPLFRVADFVVILFAEDRRLVRVVFEFEQVA